MFTINCKGIIKCIDRPLVMGVLNITPDSFYEGHLHKSRKEILALADQMVSEGADIIDIGGQSTRPGSAAISATAELERVLPVIEGIREKHPALLLSIDSYYSRVAAAAVAAGASLVNDISAGEMDAEMIPIVAGLKVPYICMHMKGVPETMQKDIHYEDVLTEVLDFFISKTAQCISAGILDIIIDPGFGFGKTPEHNFSLLKQLSVFRVLGKPILVGLSRKSTIYRTLGITAAEALNGTTVLNTMALMNGASLLRVHDVRAAKEAVTLFCAYDKAPPGRDAL